LESSTKGEVLCGSRRIVLLTILAFVAWVGVIAGVVDAKVYLDVYGWSYRKISIAVPPFMSGERERSEISDLLNQDLDMSGFFVVTPRSMIDKGFLSEGVDRESIRFDQWQSLGLDLLCKGVVEETANGIALLAYLYDVGDGSLLLAKKFEAPSSDWRRAVHHLADEIILQATGEKGIMSSRIIFVAGQKDVYVSDLDGDRARNLTNYDRLVVSPAVSPDGKYLAFTSYREGKPCLWEVQWGLPLTCR